MKKQIEMQFQAGTEPDGRGINFFASKPGQPAMYVSVEVPAGASEDYGYITLKHAVLEAVKDAGGDPDAVRFPYDGQEDQLAADATVGEAGPVDLPEEIQPKHMAAYELRVKYANGETDEYYMRLTGEPWRTCAQTEAEALQEMQENDPETFHQLEDCENVKGWDVFRIREAEGTEDQRPDGIRCTGPGRIELHGVPYVRTMTRTSAGGITADFQEARKDGSRGEVITLKKGKLLRHMAANEAHAVLFEDSEEATC